MFARPLGCRRIGTTSPRFAAAIGPLLMLSALTTWPSVDAGEFDPYFAYVSQDTAHARCGPGLDFYRTDPLNHGQKVEVYAETADGWLGIRPPEDSFCWVPADAVDEEGSAGVINEDRTVAWIGTQLGRAKKYRWQIQLDSGEAVSILGRAERDGPDGPQPWLRIVPPSGEFRWVHRDQVVFSSEALVASLRDNPKVVESVRDRFPQAPRRPKYADSADQLEVAGSSGETIVGSGLVPVPRKIAERLGDELVEPWRADESRDLTAATTSSQLGTNSPSPVKPVVDSEIEPSTRAIGSTGRFRSLASAAFDGRPRLRDIGNALTGATDGVATVSATSPTRTISATRIEEVREEVKGKSVDELSVILGRLMAAQASAPEVAPVADAVSSRMRSATDTQALARARTLADRIDQYSRLADRRDGRTDVIDSTAPQLPMTAVESTAKVPDAVGRQAVRSDTNSRPAEGVTGYLVQVYSARPDSPPFAITDTTGRTVAYVSPLPGVNLRPHLNSEVAVTGTEGFLTGLNTPHIVAESAVRIRR